jgi:hypothetical protein
MGGRMPRVRARGCRPRCRSRWLPRRKNPATPCGNCCNQCVTIGAIASGFAAALCAVRTSGKGTIERPRPLRWGCLRPRNSGARQSASQPSSYRPRARGRLRTRLSLPTRDFDFGAEFRDAALSGTGLFRGGAWKGRRIDPRASLTSGPDTHVGRPHVRDARRVFDSCPWWGRSSMTRSAIATRPTGRPLPRDPAP